MIASSAQYKDACGANMHTAITPVPACEVVITPVCSHAEQQPHVYAHMHRLQSCLCAYMRDCDHAGINMLPSLPLSPHVLEGHKPVAKAEGGSCRAFQPGRRTLQGCCRSCITKCACWGINFMFLPYVLTTVFRIYLQVISCGMSMLHTYINSYMSKLHLYMYITTCVPVTYLYVFMFIYVVFSCIVVESYVEEEEASDRIDTSKQASNAEGKLRLPSGRCLILILMQVVQGMVSHLQGLRLC